MTEQQILHQINRVTFQRMALYRELADAAWLLHSQREALVKDAQALDAAIGALYDDLRRVRAGGVRVGMQTKRGRSDVIDRLRRSGLKPPSLAIARRRGSRLQRAPTASEARRAGLARLRKGVSA